MGILYVLANDDVEVLHRLVVLVNHLIRLGALVNVAQIGWDLRNALRVWKDRLFELLEAAVRESEVVVDVSRVGHEWLWIALQGLLHHEDALLVLFEGKVGDALFVEHLGVASFVLERSR